MAYSDYGGYAYQNGILVPENSDVNNYHVWLGDGDICMGMYKQSTISFYEKGNFLQLKVIFDKKYITDDGFFNYDDSTYNINLGYFEGEIKNNKIKIYFTYEDNFYSYAYLEQTNGVIWTGFCGYGVGAGLEDCGYGFSTNKREQKLFELFPMTNQEEN